MVDDKNRGRPTYRASGLGGGTMKQALDDAVVDVVVDCHRRLRVADPGSEAADVAEHAISLALSPARPPKDRGLLLHDVLRQARHSVRRTRARRGRAVNEVRR